MTPTSPPFPVRGAAVTWSRRMTPLPVTAVTVQFTSVAIAPSSGAEGELTCQGKAVTIFAGPVVASHYVDGSGGGDVILLTAGGARRCIGADLTIVEEVAVLREVFRRYDVTALVDDEPKVHNITTWSPTRRPLRITARN